MIFVYTGKTGSGKTKAMIDEVYKYWKNGSDIYSNTFLFFEKYGGAVGSEHRNWKGQKVKRGKIVYFQDISEIIEIRDAIVVFDEAQVLMNARQWDVLPAEFQYKLQQHRKHNLHLFATTQNVRFIDLTIRVLIQEWTHCTRLIGIGDRPCWVGLFRYEKKDLDALPVNNADDSVVPVIASTNKLISQLWSRRLYDTYFAVGFKRLKTVITKVLEGGRWRTKGFIIPRNLSLSEGQKSISTLRSALGMSRSATSSRS